MTHPKTNHTDSNEEIQRTSRYRLVWRWHFYAGLFVMPLLLVLALSGTVYCFKPQVENLLYRVLFFVAPPSSAKR